MTLKTICTRAAGAALAVANAWTALTLALIRVGMAIDKLGMRT